MPKKEGACKKEDSLISSRQMPRSKVSQLTFLGGGKMAEAIFSRLITKSHFIPQEITVSDINEKRLDYLYKTYGVKTSRSNLGALDSEGPVIIAVKPQQVKEILEQIGDKVGNRLIISIAAGIKTTFLERYMPLARVIRVMPNTAALVGMAITAVSKGKKATKNDVDIAERIFGSIGQVVELGENLQNAVTAISGSGPAYFFYLTELLAFAGRQVGLSKEKSRQLAIQTAIGAGELLKTERPPEELRKMVTSSGGTTEAAIKSFIDDNLPRIVEKAVKKAYKRGEELSEG